MVLASKHISLTDAELNSLTNVIKTLTSINFDKTKAYLLENRLRPVLTRFSYTSFAMLHQAALQGNSSVLEAIIDAVTINETHFFRDKPPFELFKNKLLPDLLNRNIKTPIKIWCGACSTGQEVYSLCIALNDTFKDIKRSDIKITGTDISGEAIAKAKKAEYNHFEISRGLTTEQVKKYFTRTTNDHYQLSEEIRSMATFKQGNLLAPTFGKGDYDIIFCRNVSCYFQQQDKKKLFQNLARQLSVNGCLVLGGPENLLGVSEQFKQEKFNGAIYYRHIQ